MFLDTRINKILLAIYAVIVFLAIWGITAHAENASHLSIEVWAAIGAVGAAGAMMEILLHLRTRKALTQMKNQIEKMSQHAEVGLVMIDEQRSVEGMPGTLNQYLTLLRDRINQLKREHKELDLLVQAVDAEKHNTEAIIESISDAVLVVNAFGELTLANRQAEELFGFDLTKQKNQPVDAIVTESSLREVMNPTHWVAQSDPARFEYTLKSSASEKTGIYIVTVSPVYIQKNELWAIAMSLHDVTHERELAQLKNDFVNHVSHELRTPLSSIKAYVELLLDGDIQNQGEQINFYRIIQTEADRLDRFIANMLNLSRIESGLMAVEFSEIELNAELQQAVNLIRFVAEEKNITLEFSPAESEFIQADRDLLRQVVLNLLSNAIKYTPEGGKVTLSTGYDDHDKTCWVRVRDSGIGISSSDRERIFDKFYRCTGESRELSSGTGLGLTLVKKVVEQIHHGRISVETRVGYGSTFTIILPINPIACEKTQDKQEVLA